MPFAALHRLCRHRIDVVRTLTKSAAAGYDMALLKNVRLTESKSLQFRLEAFNIFNHAQFFGPQAVDGNIDSSTFGTVINAASPRLLQLGAKFFF